MLLYRTWTSLVCLVAAVNAHVFQQRQASGDLAVSLAPASSGKATEIQATITNTGVTGLSLLRLGTILDSGPVKKLTVTNEDGVEVPFLGIELSLHYEALQSEHFDSIPAKSSLTRVIDLAVAYDLEPGTYSIFADGTFPAVSGQSTKAKTLSFKSETIKINIEESSTAELKENWSKRTIFQEDGCTADQREATLNGIRNCEPLARAAAADAANVHSARFVEYFKSNETHARKLVSGRLLAVADECSTTDSGETKVQCKDNWGYCESEGPLIAYTTWVNGYVTMCPLFYDTLPPLPQKCHKQDHATTTIHEMTHARAVYEEEVSTNDYAYGYQNSTALDAVSCLYNADSYSLYANAVYLDC
ncbi:Deuterolysin metalloprotease family-domain-containing protein [Dactylonectria estremocensis]|uniref:Neutral protease 2 n=1 Tax=Dactylonectria estremocensis TaxID=1079267 RepID=A0A9P9E2B9_9HYPO|nr:Deuterolysin metalloprotease family-domain-containing protein [Dactylonectria estremocensis]